MATAVIITPGGQLGAWNGGTFTQSFTIAGTGYGEANQEAAIRLANANLLTTLSGSIALAGSATIGAAGTGLVIDKSAIVSAVGEVMVAQSEHAYFDSDSIALRCTWRFGANVVRPDRIGKFTVTAPS